MVSNIAGVEIGMINDTIVINPTTEQMAISSLRLTLAGTKDSILMVEGN